MWHGQLLFLILFFQAGSYLEASDQASSFPPERRVVFTCLSWDDEIDTLYYRTLTETPKAPVPHPPDRSNSLIIGTGSLRISGSFRSEPQPYLGPAIIEFFPDRPLIKPISPQQVTTPVSSVVLPPDQNRLLLLFFKQTAITDHTGPQYRIEILPDSSDVLTMGGYLLMNCTGKNLIGSVGKQSFELQARSTKQLPSPSDTSQKLEWLFWNELHQEKPLYSSIWQHRSDSKTLIFIAESAEQRGALTIKAIQDIRDPADLEVDPPLIPK